MTTATVKPKASDIPDEAMLRAVNAYGRDKGMWAIWWDLRERYFPALPEKVVLAKLRQLLKRELVQGCGCGCRGDFELEPKGAALIDEQPWREPWWANPVQPD